MLIREVRRRVRADLESPAPLRRAGTGWVSGVTALVLSLAGLFFVLCLRYPSLLTVPQLRGAYDHPAFRLGLHLLLVFAFASAAVSLVLRANKVLGFTALTLTLTATILDGSRVPAHGGRSLRGRSSGWTGSC